mmetsp:Transcript_861/g.2811  ORF Transcript_861/g.2811 Transcript_861/m.2811 type:complete len:108 (+) Transcript_861:222-545(+)
MQQLFSSSKRSVDLDDMDDPSAGTNDRSRQGGVDAKVHKKLKGGMRRVDSVELAKLRIPQAVRSNKKRGTSRMMRERQAGASRGNGGSGGSLSFMGIGGGVGEMIKS